MSSALPRPLPIRIPTDAPVDTLQDGQPYFQLIRAKAGTRGVLVTVAFFMNLGLFVNLAWFCLGPLAGITVLVLLGGAALASVLISRRAEALLSRYAGELLPGETILCAGQGCCEALPDRIFSDRGIVALTPEAIVCLGRKTWPSLHPGAANDRLQAEELLRLPLSVIRSAAASWSFATTPRLTLEVTPGALPAPLTGTVVLLNVPDPPAWLHALRLAERRRGSAPDAC